MKKTLDDSLDETLERMRRGNFEVLSCDHYLTGKDPEELRKGVEELKRLMVSRPQKRAAA